jgi:hypothetical protein
VEQLVEAVGLPSAEHQVRRIVVQLVAVLVRCIAAIWSTTMPALGNDPVDLHGLKVDRRKQVDHEIAGLVQTWLWVVLRDPNDLANNAGRTGVNAFEVGMRAPAGARMLRHQNHP